ncbi:hypothetical protein Vi05172_g4784 [Venturia inaequalis]|nr:hypothetical protein Vi05172_g4784 [Venturia inaequalis]
MPHSKESVPKRGQWPVDPQDDQECRDDRIWVDGCFDFAHHGHAGAMLQARRLGNELLVGVHSDESIMENKGPTVMTLKERVLAVEACRWATKAIPEAPYVTSLPWISHYGCQYVVHGDDITSDSSGEDCYRYVKAAGRFKVVKRTPGISTTDLVGRMLLCTRNHFIKSLERVLVGEEGPGGELERKALAEEMTTRIKEYASDESGKLPSSEVWTWNPSRQHRARGSSSSARPSLGGHRQSHSEHSAHDRVHDDPGIYHRMVVGKEPLPGQRVVYVDGGFDLFSSGHIAFLKAVVKLEEQVGVENKWYTEEAKAARIAESGRDYIPYFIVAGVHDDEVINHYKGINYPIMNIFERGLCVLQCKYINAIVFSAPFTPTPSYLSSLPYGQPSIVYHGPTSFMPTQYDPYSYARQLKIFKEVPQHDFQHVNSGEIVERILKSRAMYEERQRVKGVKGVGEEAVRTREKMEEELKIKQLERRWSEVEKSFGV